MIGLLLAGCFTFAPVTSARTANSNQSPRDNATLEIKSLDFHSDRQGKFFPLFSVVRFANSECLSSTDQLNGTCFTRRECTNFGGNPSGPCANGLGTCCVFQKSCGSTTNINNTYFVNPRYPITYRGGERCSITVQRCNSNICQLRLDFLEATWAQPNATGWCDFDVFLVSGGSSTVPRICGENTNQHVYVDFNGATPITISVDTNADYAFDRRWNIRIQQIACDSVCKAPNGCLQYYKSVSGTVMSFNFGTTENARAPQIGTRQMVNHRYGVCVRMELGYCSIEWSQADRFSFSVSGDTGSFDPDIIGTDLVAESGAACTTDFVIVPDPRENGIPANTDRFCGNGFITKTSDLKPFVMYVVTNGDEMLEAQNKGFRLMFRQIPCAV
ncbi:hypothetical protein DMN91_005680 [Ooceraea biroi]|uniref:CUB domain-containing protein n=1 Tax=Ooceraea biroi TaxID=2015173 RepID=A0A026W196_OOCBI|nr:uncharacterized protein LOC105284319 isoform X1 [Ooceraea biroi]EZA49837.1 hypothetical protein X777_11818 [Ooceraea biroi]RLU21307.1 hypothetical protein DMN91_005680 [Ooceraea biroi]